MGDQKTKFTHIVASVLDVQQTMATQFEQLTKSLEALKIEHHEGIAQLREDLRRSDDRAQKQFADQNALHGKELERLHQIIATMLARDSAQAQVQQFGAALAAQVAGGVGGAMHPQQHQLHQMLLRQQMEMQGQAQLAATAQGLAQAQAQLQAQAQAQAQLQAQAQAQAQQSALAGLLAPKAPVVPAPQLPVKPVPTAQPTFTIPKPAEPLFPVKPEAEAVKPPVFPPKAAPAAPVDNKPQAPVVSSTTASAAPVAKTTPATTGFTFGTGSSLFGKKPEAAVPANQIVIPKADAPAAAAKDDEDEENDEEYEPEATFAPVIPLPDLVEVKTGEESEEVMFNNRSKLYIWSKETSEWKERGTGDLKVLQNKETKKWRVVMRREQVLKVCANFPIVGSMSLQQMQKNEKAYTWFCEDFSEDEPAHVKLSARFANVEIATEFKKLFERAVAEHKNAGTTGTAATKEAKKEIKKEVKKEIKEEPKEVVIPANKKQENGFGDQFKPKSGEWECPGCYVTVKAGLDQCECCNTKKDGTAGEKNIFSKPSILKPAPGTPKIAFGFGASAAPAVASPAAAPAAAAFGSSLNGSPSTTNTSVFGGGNTPKQSIFGGGGSGAASFSFNASASPAPAAAAAPAGPLFNFNQSKTPAAASPSVAASSSSAGSAGFTFGGTPKFSFGKPVTSSPAVSATSANTSTSSIFGSMATGGASFASVAANSKGSIFDQNNTDKAKQELASQKKSSLFGSKANTTQSSSKNENGEEEEEGEDGEYEPDAEYQPVIPLPDLVEVVTGEESEEVVFSARCKLFKYFSDLRENKERGVGDLKVLKDKENKYRIVMRREQVHKICANFRITKDMKMTQKPNMPQVLTFVCQDFSEDATTAEAAIFTVKFKDASIAGDFEKAVKEAQTNM